MDSSNVEHGPVVIDDENEHQRALEDQWIEGMGNSEMNVNGDTSGEYTTLLKGLILGFIFPIMPLFFFRTSLFSKRFQVSDPLPEVWRFADLSSDGYPYRSALSHCVVIFTTDLSHLLRHDGQPRYGSRFPANVPR